MTYKAKAPTQRPDQVGFRPKRFWKETRLSDAANGIAILLDGRPVKTPKGHALVLPTRVLAQQVEAEWAAVGEYLDYEAMPLTRLAFASVDRMGETQDAMIAEVLRYCETDLVCYPSAYPEALKAREAAVWEPILKWAEAVMGLRFVQNLTLTHVPQPPQTLQTIQALVMAATPYEQAGIMLGIPLFGSVVLTLAVWRGHLSGEAAFLASRIGEDFQSDIWGRDEEAANRAAGIKAQAQALEVWFRGLV
ncbi:MAG: ATP12 family protein [Asticcacaulis sp.]